MARLVRALSTHLNHVPLKSAIASLPRQTRLSPVYTILSDYEKLDVNEFRRQAFDSGHPVLITKSTDGTVDTSPLSNLPAIRKWFTFKSRDDHGRYMVNHEYFEKVKDTIVPYELLRPQINPLTGEDVVEEFRDALRMNGHYQLAKSIPHLDTLLTSQEVALSGRAPHFPQEPTFYHFYAPLALFLQAAQHEVLPAHGTIMSQISAPRLPCLYIAQAQISDLPMQLQDDLPTPNLVKRAGKGDVYDANIWVGTPPTYTPLHKDPNPNLFVQLASNKIVRLFPPDMGLSIFHTVQQQLGGRASSSFRGEEMMQGPERYALEQAVWYNSQVPEGFEVIVRPGDALFIPKGWWHSIKSLGTDITASVNWWFR